MTQIENEQRRLAQRKAQLMQTIAGLASLIAVQPAPEEQTLADAVRTAINGEAINDPETVFTAKKVRSLLEEYGFDFSGYHSNHLAAIHTAMRRMCKSGVLKQVGDAEGYRWNAPLL